MHSNFDINCLYNIVEYALVVTLTSSRDELLWIEIFSKDSKKRGRYGSLWAHEESNKSFVATHN